MIAELLAAIYPLADLRRDRGKMPVKAVVGRAIPAMLDDDILPVVRVAWRRVRVDHGASRDRADCVERFAVRIPPHRLDIDAFMEARVDETDRGLDWVPHKPILPTFPRGRFHAFVSRV